MMRFALRVLLAAAVSCSPGCCFYGEGWENTHRGSQIWSVHCESAEDCEFEDHLTLDVLHRSDEGFHHILVTSQQINTTRNYMDNRGIVYTIQVEDYADYLMDQHKSDLLYTASRADEEQCTESSCPAAFLHEYMSFQQIEWFLKDLARSYVRQVWLESAGKTLEGRDIWLVRVVWDRFAASRPKQKAVFVEAGTHAREWISPATALNILIRKVQECRTGTGRDNCEYVYYFMPLHNPDGYEYTRNTYRLWRKNRSKPPVGSSCYGTDLNRNWEFKWGVSGSNLSACSNNYQGSRPSSTEEVTAEVTSIQTVISDYDLVLYITYHSFSQLVLYPYGYAEDALASNDAQLKKLSHVYSDAAFGVHGKRYEVKKSSGLYPASGVSDDHVYSLGVKVSLTIELRPDESVSYSVGFELPASQIKPIVEENWAGFKALEKELLSDSTLLSRCVMK